MGAQVVVVQPAGSFDRRGGRSRSCGPLKEVGPAAGGINEGADDGFMSVPLEEKLC